MSRIYVGSINFELNEEHIRSSFSQFGHIKDISMTLDPATGRHKGYCFVEFLAPDAAQLALDSMNGWYLGGRQIKVGRPNNYNPAILPAPTLIPTRIYVSNINKNITEDNIRSIFESFGELKECLLLPEVSEYSKCAYIEFQDENKVQATVNSMNNLELEGQPLRVCKAFYGGPLSREMCSNSPASRWSKSHEVKDSATEDGSLDEDLSIGVNQRYTIMQKLFRNLNTRSQNALQNVPQKIGILQQEACPDARALILDQIALVRNIDADFETEISMECEKFGEINGMFICINEREDRISHSKCTDYANVDLDSRISVYVLFDSHKSCLNAQAALDKRFFAGRIVNAVLCKTQDYNNSSKYAFNIKKFSENQTNLDKSFNMCT